MRKWITVVWFSCLFFPAIAQRANYRLAERMMTNSLAFDYQLIAPSYVPGSDNFWFRLRTVGGERYFFVDVKSGKIEKLFDPKRLAAELGKVTGKTYNPDSLGFWRTPFKKDGVTLFWRDGTYSFEYNRKTEKLHAVPMESKMDTIFMDLPKFRHPSLSPDGRYQVLGKACNLYLKNRQDSTLVQLTFDGGPGFAYSPESDMERVWDVPVEWAEDSKSFCHFRDNSRHLGEVSVMNYLKGRPLAENTRMELAGDSVVLQTEFSLFDAINAKQIKVKLDKWKDQYVRMLQMSPDLQHVYVERRKRTCDALEICRVDVRTGEVKVLIHEEGKPYIGVELGSIHFLNDYQDIIMWSERTGYGHFYHYDGEGHLKNVITGGNWSAGQMVRIDTLHREIYFEAYGITSGENPSYAKICRANIDGKGKVTVLTPEEATHRVQFLPSGRYMIDIYSRPDQAPRFNIRDMKGRLVVKLGEADLTGLYRQGWKLPETFSVKAADGKTDLYGVMWKPFDFDSTRKYPIISAVYPGPQTDKVPLHFEYNSLNERLAQIGFVVVAFNHRGGLPYRGSAYHTFGYGNIRDYALEDDRCGLQQLIERYPFVDGEKVGIYGHSGGGMMSAAAICTYPDFYKAAVSSAGNHDNRIYTRFFVETHHGIKEVEQEMGTGCDSVVVRKTTRFQLDVPTNMELAKNLKGHLMLVAGGCDGNVHPANTFRMVDALINSGKDVEFVYLPQARHTYDGVYDWYFQHKLWSHFAKYLLGDFTTPCFYDIEFDERMNKVKKAL